MVIEIGELLHDMLVGAVIFFPGAYVVGKLLDTIRETKKEW